MINKKQPDFSEQIAYLQTQFLPCTYLIAVVGYPGSGKTRFCAQLRDSLDNCVVISTDNYLLPLASLSPEQQLYRGRMDTLDLARLEKDLKGLKEGVFGRLPFCKNKGQDPVAGLLKVDQHVRYVVVEGVYLLMRQHQMQGLFDLKVYLQCDLTYVKQRLRARYQRQGLFQDRDDLLNHVIKHDFQNGLESLRDSDLEGAVVVYNY